MSGYKLVCCTEESTVVSEYTPAHKTAADYQSEADLEREFIKILTGQCYDFLPITSETALIANSA